MYLSKEYVRFTHSTSPYFDKWSEDSVQQYILGYNEETHQCEYLYMVKTNVVLSQEYATRADRTDILQMGKLLMGYDDTYFNTAYIYYAVPWLEYYFGDVLGGSNTADFICDKVLGSEQCIDAVGPTENCHERLSALPIAEGENLYVDGNSRGCRALHAAFAVTNPKHCAHVALDRTVDSEGRVRCQNTTLTGIEQFFSDSDLDLWNRFAEINGLDGNEGYRVIESG